LKRKPRILIFIDWFWPGYLAGGPVQSVISLIQHLQDDFDFKVFTSDTDLKAENPYPNIKSGEWGKSHFGCEVYYAPAHQRNYKFIKKFLHNTQFDGVLLNSLFSTCFSIYPLLILKLSNDKRPIFFAPRGMLGKGALAIKSLKKKLFISFTKTLKLHSKVHWIASSPHEEKEIKAVYSNADISTISNLPKNIVPSEVKTNAPGIIRLVYVSRISSIKNLDFAIGVLAAIPETAVRFNIYGPIEDAGYWNKCKEKISNLPANKSVHYKGVAAPDQIEQIFKDEDWMFLPTQNENFGHSIVESLLCGCPVIISDQTPWSDVEVNNAGYAFPLNEKEKFETTISKLAFLDADSYRSKSAAATRYILGKIQVDKIKNQYISLFNEQLKN
jgi:glycosyltransferase involved in cell wall biosynthesis